MSQGRATEVLVKAFKNYPGSGLQVRLVDESGLAFTASNPLPVDTEINLVAGSVIISDINAYVKSGNILNLVDSDAGFTYSGSYITQIVEHVEGKTVTTDLSYSGNDLMLTISGTVV